MPARLRLAARPSPPGPGPAAGPGPVVLFLPAHDEVASVVGRVPERVGGHPVRCLVVDDGSGDRTAELAEEAGALVLGSAGNQGLGAAVRPASYLRQVLPAVWRELNGPAGQRPPGWGNEELGRGGVRAAVDQAGRLKAG